MGVFSYPDKFGSRIADTIGAWRSQM